MIRVEIKKKNNIYNEISVKGHAMYDDYGKDIVCSAVSSIITTSINCILALDKDGLKYKANSGDVVISNIKNDEKIIKLLDVTIKMLTELKNDYPLNIEISKED